MVKIKIRPRGNGDQHQRAGGAVKNFARSHKQGRGDEEGIIQNYNFKIMQTKTAILNL
jgi:hypothetical protein